MQKDIPPKSIRHRCEVCQLLQKSTLFTPTYGGTLAYSCLTTYFATYSIKYSPNEMETVEEHFLNTPEFEMCINKNCLVTSIVHPNPELREEDCELISAETPAIEGEANAVQASTNQNQIKSNLALVCCFIVGLCFAMHPVVSLLYGIASCFSVGLLRCISVF